MPEDKRDNDQIEKMTDEERDKLHATFIDEIKKSNDDVALRRSAQRVEKRFQDSGGRSWVTLTVQFARRPLHILRHLIPLGFPVNIADVNGWMPLHYTVRGCKVIADRPGLILLLLANGAKVDVKTTDEGLSAFMVSCLIGDVQIAELLLGRGASIHSTDRYGNSALHLAAKHTKLNMIQFLLYRGLTANCRNIHQESPDMVVGECEDQSTKDPKRIKKIRKILKENGVLQKKLAQSYKEKLRAERKERESLESISTRGKWDFTCEELLNSIENALCGSKSKDVEDDFPSPMPCPISRNIYSVSGVITTDPAKGFEKLTRPIPLA